VGSLSADQSDGRPAAEDTYLPSGAELDAVQAEIEGLGAAGLASTLDVCDDHSVEVFVNRCTEQLGPPDVVVAAAGASAYQLLAGHDDRLWHKMIDTNLNGTYRVIKRVLPGMIERGWGRIVIIGSTSASVGAAGQAAYSAAKAGLLGLMRCAALEGAPHGVTCNMVSPATVETPMMRSSFGHKAERSGRSIEEHHAESLERYPQGRFLQVEEVAALVAFLAGDAASGITMENIGVTGGAIY